METIAELSQCRSHSSDPSHRVENPFHRRASKTLEYEFLLICLYLLSEDTQNLISEILCHSIMRRGIENEGRLGKESSMIPSPVETSNNKFPNVVSLSNITRDVGND